jgi:hypothetical protein
MVDNRGPAQGASLEGLTPGQLLAAWETAPALVTVTVGAAHVHVFQNAASRTLFGARELGVPLRTAFPEIPEDSFEAMDRVVRDGVPVRRFYDPVGVRGVHGADLHLLYVFAPLAPSQDGRWARGVVITAIDVTGQVDAERLAAHARLLAEVSGRMNAAVDADGALGQLTDALVPTLADVAAVYVRPVEPALPVVAGTGGSPERPPEALAPPRAVTVAPDLLDRVGMPPTSGPPSERPRWLGAFSAGRPVLLDVPPPGAGAVLTPNPTDRWLAAAGGHTIAVLPLAVAGELSGALVLLSAGARAPFTAADVPFLEDVAARAGATVTQLRTFDQHRQIARDLQRALLPDVPTTLPGLRVAARYVAGGPGVEVGGDWWDVHDLGGGRTGIGVGDVAGRGLSAAVVMGQTRSAMHTAARAGLSPARILELLDLQLADLVRRGTIARPDHPQFATASYAVVDRVAGTLTVANAGHPPLLLRGPAAPTVLVEAVPGPPLGIGLGGYEELVVPFGPGCLLAAFTDGLVESRRLDVGAGIELLRSHVDRVRPGDLEQTVDGLLHAMNGQTGSDDVALLLVHDLG